MDAAQPYALLADVVLVLHFGVVVFVVGGAALVLAGGLRGWRWVRAPLWRWVHAGAIVVVVTQAWLGEHCPLTILEVWLRMRSRVTAYETSFVEHWVQRLLYYEAPPWAFLLVYSLFALLVLWLWWRFPPRSWAGGAAGE